ncbi:dihydrofolate reductase family protein [Nakamurella aerolata]|uniref:Pyrimidine reductase family protein n=1 Tax=Nakamurella aerolata TaxID=1656892 RepID=A0A849AAV3_9ACTN|nr:pyrimidine reductase family protein [Nakamurella aerolata]
MQLLFPPSVPGQPMAPTRDLDLSGKGDLTTVENALAAVLAWPAAPGPDGVTVRANMVESLDGGTTVAGSSAALSDPADQKLMGLQRDLSDVVLVGAGTVIDEKYPGARDYPKRQRRRERWHRTPVPRWAIVASRPLPDDLPALVDSAAAGYPAYVLSPDGVAQPDTAEVIRTGADLDLRTGLRALAEGGAHRVLCEGGPHLLGRLVRDGLLDELCLTIAPYLLGTGTTMALLGGTDLADTDPTAEPWQLASLLAESNHLFARYRRP